MDTYATVLFLVFTLVTQFLGQFITCPDKNYFYLFVLTPDSISYLEKLLRDFISFHA